MRLFIINIFYWYHANPYLTWWLTTLYMLQGNNGKHRGLQDGTNYYTLPFLFLCPISNIEKIFMHILIFRVHWWLPLKPPMWSGGEESFHTTPTVQYWSVPEEVEGWTVIIHRHWPKVAKTFNMNEGSIFAFRFSSFPDEMHLSMYCLWC